MSQPPDSPRGEDEAPARGETSFTLLQQLKANDPQAWWRLVYLYGPLVEQWARRWQLQAEDLKDVCQEVFLAVAVRIGEFRRDRPSDSFRGWLWTIVRHKIGDHFRRLTREQQLLDDMELLLRSQGVPEEAPEEDAATQRGLLERARDLIRSEFEERTWQMFWRSAVEGQPTDVIAADYGITPNGVRLARSRVHRRLQEELGELSA